MDKYTVEKITSKKIWEGFLLTKEIKSFLQSWNWGEVNEFTGSKIIRLGFRKNGKIVGVSQFVKENAKRGPHLLIPGGPIIDWSDRNLVNFFIECLKKTAIEEKVWFVRLRPELLESSENRSFFKTLGLITSPMHLNAENTWILDVSKSEEDLLRGMRKSTRYLIKKSLLENLGIVLSNKSSDSKILFGLQKETAKRHDFIGFSENLFKTEIEVFSKDDTGTLFICKQGKTVLAAAIIIFYGSNGYYHFSGSTSKHSKVPFSYFLQWKIIQEVKRRGLKYYNFWGIAPNDNPNHRFAGVTLFKTGFGGERIDWMHAHDMPISPMYWATYVFETLRRKLRRL